MTLWHLVTKEIYHQKLTFGLGILSILAAVGVLVAELTLFKSHDEQTKAILAEKEARTAEEMAVMEDDYRKIMLKLGFNLLILPKEQRLEDYYAEGYINSYMPEEYAHRLTSAGLMTIQHILPSLEQQIKWPERGGRAIILVGTRGETSVAHLAPKKPMLLAVAPGEIVVGYELWKSLGLESGDKVKLLGEEFKVSKLHPERGSKDDITVWIDLAQAQKMLGRQGKINAILALKCICAGNELWQIREDVARILPETQVIEVDTKVIARAEARERARVTAERALAAEQDNRARLRRERENFAAWLIPLVIIGSVAWIALLAWGNVRQRRGEIGILRAIGLRSGQILLIFLAKAFLLGIIGAVLGYAAGFAVGVVSGELTPGTETAGKLFSPGLLLLALVSAPMLSGFASWIPALVAARTDPAEILREE
ncbi:MAG TPA: FtsX-like permease family protein [archaeon]|nr:FtsX-like permease family protein [archaeon]